VVAFSPDGKLLATGNTDKNIRFWSVAGTNPGQPVRALVGPDAIDSLAISPDGKRLATAGPDGTTRMWDVATGKEIVALRGRQAAFAPDGKVLATGGADGTIRLWDVATGKELRVFETAVRVELHVTFAPDGKTVAMAGGVEEDANPSAREVILWDAATGQVRVRLRGHTDRVFALAFSPDGKRLASASGDGTVIIWRREGRAVARPVPRADNLVSDRLDQLLNQLLTGNRTDEQIAEALYLATIGRLPTDGEKARFAKLQRERPDARQQTFEQLLKALTENPECRAHLKTLQERLKDVPEW
jgi:WD40 repeat protein